MSIMFALIIIVVAIFLQSVSCLKELEPDAALGKDYYEELKQLAENSYDPCWSNTIKKLKASCNSLQLNSHKKLAFELTNCFLIDLGGEGCPCTDDDISKCLSSCTDKVFYTYTKMFIHIYAVCHFLQQKSYQTEMAKTAVLLKINSEKVNSLLTDSAKSLVDLQENLIAEQKKSIINSKKLTHQILKSREHAQYMYNEFNEATQENKNLILKIFEKFRNFEIFLLAELSLFHSIIYYATITAITYVLSSVPRTCKARFYMLAVIIFNLGLERIIQEYTLNTTIELNIQLLSESLAERIWLCRYMCCVILIAMLIYFFVSYEDMLTSNNRILKKLYAENKDFQALAMNFFNAAIEAHPLAIENPEPVPAEQNESDSDEEPENDAIVIGPVRRLKNIKKKLKEIADLKEQVEAGLVVPNMEQEIKLARWEEIRYLITSLETAVD